MKIRSHTGSLFTLQPDWLEFEIKVNSLTLKRLSYSVGVIILSSVDFRFPQEQVCCVAIAVLS